MTLGFSPASSEERLSFIRGRGEQSVIITVQRRQVEDSNVLLAPLTDPASQIFWVDAMTGQKSVQSVESYGTQQTMVRFDLNSSSAYRVMVLVPQVLYHSCQEGSYEPTISLTNSSDIVGFRSSSVLRILDQGYS